MRFTSPHFWLRVSLIFNLSFLLNPTAYARGEVHPQSAATKLLHTQKLTAIKEQPSLKDADPQVIITPPKAKVTRELLLMPLELPHYLFMALTAPIKATGAAIEKHSVVQRVTNFLSNDEGTFWVYPIAEGGFGGGLGGGLALSHSDLFHKNYKLHASYLVFQDSDQRAGFSIGHSHLWQVANHPLGFKFKTTWQRESEEPFYGQGNDSDKDNETRFGFDNVITRLSFPYALKKKLHLIPLVGYHAIDARPGRDDDDPSAETVFPPSEIPGFDNTIGLGELGLVLSYDTRDTRIAPNRGQFLTTSFRRFQGLTDSNYNYNEYNFKITQYIPLGKDRYVFVLRNLWSFQQATGNSSVPFFQLNTLDVNSPLRSFDYGRFRDNGLALLNAEYRYPIWDFIDGSVFIDTGRVFNDFSDLSFSHLKYSAGGGIAIHTKSQFILRLQGAYGNEGSNVVFSFGKAYE